jgi:tRNA-dihydrouridine synthase
MKRGHRIPLTIKVRTGRDESSRNVREIAQVAGDAGVAWIAIHGRTRAQGYSGASDWELIRDVTRSSPIPVIGNGDLITAAQAVRRIEQGYSHAVMIGRGALKNPWIFREILGQHDDNYNFTRLVERHFDLAVEKKDRSRAFLSLKKFLAWYATGYPYASSFRASLFQSHDLDELRGIALGYFRDVDHVPKTDDGQPFLMGGHG